MNPYVRNLNRLEFVITRACTGKCKHCSEGECADKGVHMDPQCAAGVVQTVAGMYDITSVMTFGGEPLLFPETVCAVHAAAREVGIPRRQLITNGYFSWDEDRIGAVAQSLAAVGVNEVLLSVDAFHQESIPLPPVRCFADALCRLHVPLRVHPAWLVDRSHDNPYNRRTREILAEFQTMGISVSEGNVIFPAGNALKYLGEYFDHGEYVNPYKEDPRNIKAISVDPDGGVLGGNILQKNILKILEQYAPGRDA
ncbi:MAG: radical SAM protein [Clostridia bacterium]|nr:radical SAM protein [Clostridia bacterium]